MTIEEHEQDGEKTYQYVLNAEPSNLFETKIRHSSNIKINNKRFSLIQVLTMLYKQLEMVIKN